MEIDKLWFRLKQKSLLLTSESGMILRRRLLEDEAK